MEKRLEAIEPGGRLLVLATDPVAKLDIALFCRRNGHECSTSDDANGVLRFDIVKARGLG